MDAGLGRVVLGEQVEHPVGERLTFGHGAVETLEVTGQARRHGVRRERGQRLPLPGTLAPLEPTGHRGIALRRLFLGQQHDRLRPVGSPPRVGRAPPTPVRWPTPALPGPARPPLLRDRGGRRPGAGRWRRRPARPGARPCPSAGPRAPRARSRRAGPCGARGTPRCRPRRDRAARPGGRTSCAVSSGSPTPCVALGPRRVVLTVEGVERDQTVHTHRVADGDVELAALVQQAGEVPEDRLPAGGLLLGAVQPVDAVDRDDRVVALLGPDHPVEGTAVDRHVGGQLLAELVRVQPRAGEHVGVREPCRDPADHLRGGSDRRPARGPGRRRSRPAGARRSGRRRRRPHRAGRTT